MIGVGSGDSMGVHSQVVYGVWTWNIDNKIHTFFIFTVARPNCDCRRLGIHFLCNKLFNHIHRNVGFNLQFNCLLRVVSKAPIIDFHCHQSSPLLKEPSQPGRKQRHWQLIQVGENTQPAQVEQWRGELKEELWEMYKATIISLLSYPKEVVRTKGNINAINYTCNSVHERTGAIEYKQF